MKARNLRTNNYAVQRGRKVMCMSSWSFGHLIQCDLYLVTNTMTGATCMAWYRCVTLIVSVAIP